MLMKCAPQFCMQPYLPAAAISAFISCKLPLGSGEDMLGAASSRHPLLHVSLDICYAVTAMV